MIVCLLSGCWCEGGSKRGEREKKGWGGRNTTYECVYKYNTPHGGEGDLINNYNGVPISISL